jgi:hypothetical protein
MNSEQQAYFAGLMDGEGTVTILKIWCIVRAGRQKTPGYQLRIQIGMKEPAEAIVRLHELVPGYITRYGDKTCCMMRWVLTAKRAYAFLQEVYPHMITKKRQAELALKFQEHVRQLGHTWGGGQYGQNRPRSQEVLDSLDAYYLSMKALNHPQRLSDPTPLGEKR